MSEEFDSFYKPSEGESTYKDGHLYMFEAHCDKCMMTVMAPEAWLKKQSCPKCGPTYWGSDWEGFWIEVDEHSWGLCMIPVD